MCSDVDKKIILYAYRKQFTPAKHVTIDKLKNKGKT